MQRSRTGRRRGILANGPEIKARREKLGLTMDELLEAKSHIGVSRRSLQRAEQGKRLDKHNLEKIGNLVDATLDEISFSDKKDAPRIQSNQLKLERLSKVSGQFVLQYLERQRGTLTIDFNFDPTEEQAETLARLFKVIMDANVFYCRRNPLAPFNGVEEGLADLSNPIEKIRVVAGIHKALTGLANEGIHLFYGSHAYWHAYDKTVLKGPRGIVEVRVISPQKRTEFRVSSSSEDHLTIRVQRQTEEQAGEVAIGISMTHGIHPDDFEAGFTPELFLSDRAGLVEKYRQRFVEHYGVELAKPDAETPPQELIDSFDIPF